MEQTLILLISSRLLIRSRIKTQKSKILPLPPFEVYSNSDHNRWVRQLPNTLEKHGFSVMVADRLREPEWHRTIMTHLVCGVINEISRARLDKLGPPGAGEKLRAIIRAAIDENLKGSYISSIFQIVVAQKPE